MILQNDWLGWAMGALSIPLFWGMKGYAEWLYRHSDGPRLRLVRILIAYQAIPTVFIVLVLFLKRYQ